MLHRNSIRKTANSFKRISILAILELIFAFTGSVQADEGTQVSKPLENVSFIEADQQVIFDHSSKLSTEAIDRFINNVKAAGARQEYYQALEILFSLNSPSLNIYNPDLEDYRKDDINYYIGQYLTALGLPQQAIPYLNEAKSIYEINNDSKGLAAVLNGLANIYHDLEQYEQSQQHYNATILLPVIQADGTKRNLINGNIGSTYVEMEEYSKAHPYLVKAFQYFKDLNVKDYQCGFGAELLKAELYLNHSSYQDNLKLVKSDCDQTASNFVQARLHSVYGLHELKTGNQSLAIELMIKALNAARETNQLTFEKRLTKDLLEIYHKFVSKDENDPFSKNLNSLNLKIIKLREQKLNQYNRFLQQYFESKLTVERLQHQEIVNGKKIETLIVSIFLASIILLSIIIYLLGYRINLNRLSQIKNQLGHINLKEAPKYIGSLHARNRMTGFNYSGIFIHFSVNGEDASAAESSLVLSELESSLKLSDIVFSNLKGDLLSIQKLPSNDAAPYANELIKKLETIRLIKDDQKIKLNFGVSLVTIDDSINSKEILPLLRKEAMDVSDGNKLAVVSLKAA